MRKDVIQAPQNRLLASLTPSDYDILGADLEPITLSYRTSLYKAKEPIKFVYFLETGVGSLGPRRRAQPLRPRPRR